MQGLCLHDGLDRLVLWQLHMQYVYSLDRPRVGRINQKWKPVMGKSWGKQQPQDAAAIVTFKGQGAVPGLRIRVP